MSRFYGSLCMLVNRPSKTQRKLKATVNRCS